MPEHTSQNEQLPVSSSGALHLSVHDEPISQAPSSPGALASRSPGSCDEKSFTVVNPSASTIVPSEPNSLSTGRLFMAHVGAALALFLATTDATIVSTSLPTIVSELEATQTEYTWVAVAYLLTQTAFQPLYGRISDIIGRKSLLFTSMTIFAIGSMLCGVARNIDMLIGSRALAGIGGGGIVSSVWVITSEIVPFRNRAKWSQALSITWSCSAVAGPLLGGLFSGNAANISWRWGFFINLPICLVAFLVLLISLRGINVLNPGKFAWDRFDKFDFIGLSLFMTATSFIIVGLSFATEWHWISPATLSFVGAGIVILICAFIYEKRTTREPLFPPAIYANPMICIILVIIFLHNFVFNAATFYLALFYQAANGYTPLQAGIRLLPFSLGASLASMPVAWFIGFWQRKYRDTKGQNMVITVGLVISTLGFGLQNLLNERSQLPVQLLVPLVSGIGIGMLFHAPYQVFVRAMKPSELATGTSAFFLVRFTGATTGLAVAGAVFNAGISNRLPSSLTSGLSGIDFSQVSAIEPLSLRLSTLHTIASAIQNIWKICSPFLGIATILSCFLRKLPSDVETDMTADRDEIVPQCKEVSA